jgi:hypothetical protein
MLVPTGRRDGDTEPTLQARVAELEAVLGERAAELGRIETDLEAFRLRYRHEVGRLHDQLDELELAIAEAELGELSKKLEEAGAEDVREATTDPAPEPIARFTSDAVRRLFRDVAKTIHPDLASPDDVTRERRHALMIEANRAYARGDEQHLRWILEAWERSPETVHGDAPEAVQLRLQRRLAQIEAQLEAIASDLTALKESALWQLKTMVDREGVRGKDLVADMVRRLKRDIMAATNRLDAMRPRS